MEETIIPKAPLSYKLEKKGGVYKISFEKKPLYVSYAWGVRYFFQTKQDNKTLSVSVILSATEWPLCFCMAIVTSEILKKGRSQKIPF